MSDSILLVGDTITSPDLRHVVPVALLDPLIYLETATRKTIVANSLDIHLVQDLDEIEVVGFDEITSSSELSLEGSSWTALYGGLAAGICRSQQVTTVRVPPRFPVAVARALENAGVEVVPDEELFIRRRRVKTEDEIAGARRAARATEPGWDAVRKMVREESSVTSEALQVRVLEAIASHDVVPCDIIIVPHGAQSTIGHAGGSGLIEQGEPIIADLIMRDRATGIYADATRTFCLGDAPQELTEYFELSYQALSAAIAAVRPGITCGELNDIACDVFEAAGHPTQRTQQPGTAMERGFIHGLGHGLGYEVHEQPFLASGSDVEILEGEILCLEPALYRNGFGGCRLEDMVLVTSNGGELLTRYPYSLTA
jgi:Xaa-Pro aminopeptidase